MSKLLQGQDLVVWILVNNFNGQATRRQLKDTLRQIEPESSVGKTLGRAIGGMKRKDRAVESNNIIKLTADGFKYYQEDLQAGHVRRQEPDLIESKVYDAKQRKYIVTLKA